MLNYFGRIDIFKKLCYTIINRKELFPITNFGTIETLDDFPTTCEVGDICYCLEDNKVYTYYDEGLGKAFGWKEYEVNPEAMINLGMTAYEVNKMIVAQLPSLISPAQLAPAKEILCKYVEDPGYYMLLCNDIHYYTVFHRDAYAHGADLCEDVIIECLQEKGVIQQINLNTDNTAVECWIKNEDGVFMFMLFDYDWGIVPCR